MVNKMANHWITQWTDNIKGPVLHTENNGPDSLTREKERETLKFLKLMLLKC